MTPINNAPSIKRESDSSLAYQLRYQTAPGCYTICEAACILCRGCTRGGRIWCAECIKKELTRRNAATLEAIDASLASMLSAKGPDNPDCDPPLPSAVKAAQRAVKALTAISKRGWRIRGDTIGSGGVINLDGLIGTDKASLTCHEDGSMTLFIFKDNTLAHKYNIVPCLIERNP